MAKSLWFRQGSKPLKVVIYGIFDLFLTPPKNPINVHLDALKHAQILSPTLPYSTPTIPLDNPCYPMT